MADIELPRRIDTGGGSPGRSALPDAGNVPQVRVASDPGVAVPAGAFDMGGAGLEAAGKAIGGIGEDVYRAAYRQQKLHDATAVTEGKLSFEKAGMEEFHRRQTEDDPSRPDFMKDYDQYLGQRADEAVANLPDGVSPAAREKLRLDILSSRQAMADSAGRLSLAAGQQKAVDLIGQQTNQWAAQAAQNPEHLDGILGLADDGLATFNGALTPNQERDARTKARSGIVLAAVDGLVRQGKATDAEALVRSGKFDGEINVEKTLESIRDESYKLEQRQRAELNRAQASTEADMAVRVGRGQASYADLDAARAGKTIDDGAWARLTLQLDGVEEKRQEEARLRQRGYAFGNTLLADPKSKEDRKSVDLAYEATAATWKNLTPDEQVDRSIAFATQKGLVPTGLQAMIRGGLHSGNPGQVVLAADAMKRLRNANPQLLADIGDENDRRLGTLVGSLTDAGVPAAQAVQRATESLKVNKADVEARAADYDLQRGKTEADRLGSDKSWIEGKLNSVWTADPTVDPVMARQFGDIAGLEYQRTGNLDAARQFALDTVNRTWGRTRVGGTSRYMKFAPEKFYGVPDLGPDDNAKWMTEQLVADVSRGALADPASPITPDRLLVMPDPTRHAPDGRPVYTVSLKGSDGVYRAVTKSDGATPLAWAPDWSTSEEKKRRDAATAAKVDAARAARKAGVSGPMFVPDSVGGGIALP